MISSGNLSSQPFVVERQITCLPSRSAQAAAICVTDLIFAALQARRAARLPELQLALLSLQPLLHSLLVTHDLEQGAVEFAVHDMRLFLTFLYGAQGNVTAPALPPLDMLLEPLLPETFLTVRLLLPRPLANASLKARVAAINAAGLLTVYVLDGDGMALEAEKTLPSQSDVMGEVDEQEDMKEAPEEQVAHTDEGLQDEMTGEEETGLTRKTEGESECQ